MVHHKFCKYCYTPFETNQPSGAYCSQQCKNRASGYRWRHNNAHPCPDCGEIITAKAERCKSCAHKGENKNLQREKNPRWKGGVGYDADGYIRLLSKEHHRANCRGYVYEHIAVWEDANGELPKGYVIHHINGIKNDNRLSNLLAMPRGQHHFAFYLRELQHRIRDLESELSQQKLPIR